MNAEKTMSINARLFMVGITTEGQKEKELYRLREHAIIEIEIRQPLDAKDFKYD
ncbi:hypothetical protein [uncultured Desulfuromusa sp.]|uniref:hypothetical protein n=1 Tax=uncultured Desulfuromusa sp. TaxID=219183 RepID=UPI002AA79737|nr:hypothetical protein [uncultured Desulfuromusa sp.]